jgi:hypothetical protein
MTRMRAALWLSLCATTLSCPAQDRFGPFEYRSHFQPNPGASAESGSRDGWESYPLAEDAGYDPTINPETSGGQSSLIREATPTRDGVLPVGFIRRMHMASNADSSLSLSLRAPFTERTTPVVVSIFHGASEQQLTGSLRGKDWQEISLPIAASPDTITAIAVVAQIQNAVHGRPERLLMRDVRMTGLALRHVDLDASQAIWDPARDLFYLRHASHPEEDLVVPIRAEARSIPAWNLLSPDGGVKAKGTGSTIRYRFQTKDTPGLWTLRVNDGEATTTALLLLREHQPQGLLFDKPPTLSDALLASVRKRAAQLRSTVHAGTGNNIARMDAHWLLPGLPSYFSILTTPPELAMLDAIIFRATGAPEARDESLSLLNAIAQWPTWTHPWFPAHGYHTYYPVGMMTKDIVMAEQFLGDALPPATRATLDRCLIDLSVRPTYEEYVQEDRLPFNTSNWIGNSAGGALLAALQSEDPDAAGYALGLYAKDRAHIEAAYTKDGSYGEGVSYQKFDLEMTSLVAEAAHRTLGQSLDASLAGTERYIEYATYGETGLLDYGDSHVDIAPSSPFAYLASKNKSDSLAEFYFRYRDEPSPELLSRVLWESKIIKPAAPAPLPENPSKLFPERGIVVLRDSWNPASTVVAMRAGAHFNHNHADQGSIFFAHAGVLWLGEAGYADYYKDPSYATYNIQAAGHNTLLIDHDDQSQHLPGNNVFGVSPRITQSLVGKEGSLVQADLTHVYGPTLERYTRTLFHTTSGPLIVIDQVRSAQPHTFTQVWHPQQKIASLDPNANTFQLAGISLKTKLQIEAFSTAPIQTARRASPMPLALYERAEHEIVESPTLVEVSTTSPQRSATIVTVVTPQDQPNATPGKATWTKLPDGFLLTQSDLGIKIQDHPDAQAEPSILAWWANGALMLRGTQYEEGKTGLSLAFSRPVNMELTRTKAGQLSLEIEASESTDLILSRSRPQSGASALSPESRHLTKGHTSLLLP